MISDYLNQTTTLKTNTGNYDNYGKPVLTPSIINLRWENKRRLVRNSQGKEIISEAVIFTKSEMKPSDFLVWQNRDWEIISVSDITDIEGDIQFYEVSV